LLFISKLAHLHCSARAREIAGPKKIALSGNVDPMVLYGS